MADTEKAHEELNRSKVDFSVSYTTGVHTTGRKKGRDKVETDVITLIISSQDDFKVQEYIRHYCSKKNMQLTNWHIEHIQGKNQFEFDCQKCGEHSFDMTPMHDQFCSKYCREASRFS